MVSRADARDSLLPRAWPGGLDDVVEAVLTEENLVADEEGRGAEGAARDRAFGVSDQLGLDGGILAFRGDFGPGQARGIERGDEHFGIVHLEALAPHRERSEEQTSELQSLMRIQY